MSKPRRHKGWWRFFCGRRETEKEEKPVQHGDNCNLGNLQEIKPHLTKPLNMYSQTQKY